MAIKFRKYAAGKGKLPNGEKIAWQVCAVHTTSAIGYDGTWHDRRRPCAVLCVVLFVTVLLAGACFAQTGPPPTSKEECSEHVVMKAASPDDPPFVLRERTGRYYAFMADCLLGGGQYEQAIANYTLSIQVFEALEAKLLASQGSAYLKLHKNKEAVVAYAKAASLDPNPGVAYFNLCTTQYDVGDRDGALDSCDKVIALDPNKADAYFIRGSILVADHRDKEAAEALKTYLELAPNAPHADEVKEMLKRIGSSQ